MAASALRMGVIGSGPAGFYAGKALLKRFPSCRVDLIERLPVPFGLVRYGVAVDHASTRNVRHQFSSLLEGSDGRLKFFGNVPVSLPHSPIVSSLPYAELKELYHFTVLATGPSSARRLPGVSYNSVDTFSAHDLVMWLNGHPEHHSDVDFGKVLRTAHNVAVFGNGNVSLDIARLLLRPDYDSLHKLPADVHAAALEQLVFANVRRVSVMARRAPEFAAWSAAALREAVAKIPRVVAYAPHDDVRAAASRISDRRQRRVLDILLKNSRDLSELPELGEEKDGERQLCLYFSEPVDGVQQRFKGVDTWFYSVGYQNCNELSNSVGWANHARPSCKGIIGDNKLDADAYVETLAEDDFHAPSSETRTGVEQWLQKTNHPYVSWEQWKRIAEEELRRGKYPEQSIRVASIDEMMSIAHAV